MRLRYCFYNERYWKTDIKNLHARLVKGRCGDFFEYPVSKKYYPTLTRKQEYNFTRGMSNRGWTYPLIALQNYRINLLTIYSVYSRIKAINILYIVLSYSFDSTNYVMGDSRGRGLSG